MTRGLPSNRPSTNCGNVLVGQRGQHVHQRDGGVLVGIGQGLEDRVR